LNYDTISQQNIQSPICEQIFSPLDCNFNAFRTAGSSNGDSNAAPSQHGWIADVLPQIGHFHLRVLHQLLLHYRAHSEQ
jgi:hypothetical protein